MARPVLPAPNVAVVDPATGLMSPIWYQFFVELSRPAKGWAAATGTATRTTFDTATVTTALLAQRVKAIIDDDIARGLKGA
jgi:hypothetical protein